MRVICILISALAGLCVSPVAADTRDEIARVLKTRICPTDQEYARRDSGECKGLDPWGPKGANLGDCLHQVDVDNKQIDEYNEFVRKCRPHPKADGLTNQNDLKTRLLKAKEKAKGADEKLKVTQQRVIDEQEKEDRERVIKQREAEAAQQERQRQQEQDAERAAAEARERQRRLEQEKAQRDAENAQRWNCDYTHYGACYEACKQYYRNDARAVLKYEFRWVRYCEISCREDTEGRSCWKEYSSCSELSDAVAQKGFRFDCD